VSNKPRHRSSIGVCGVPVRSRDRKRAVTKPTAPRFTGLVASIDLDAADGAAASPSGYRDGRH
jgi:hypothetical protein